MVVLVLWYAKSMSQDTEYERVVADLVYESLLVAEKEAESDQRRFSSTGNSIRTWKCYKNTMFTT